MRFLVLFWLLFSLELIILAIALEPIIQELNM